MVGTFENGSPYIEIGISGATKQETKMRALVDTGFNGYLTLPYVDAFPLGLILTGIQASKLADGSTSHYFVCVGEISIGGKKLMAPIDIQPSCNILLGTGLLKKFGKKLVVDFMADSVELTEA